MDKIVFDRRYKHGRIDYQPGPTYGFEDPDAAPFFKALGIADDSDGEADVIITIGECDVHPCTVWGTGPDKGRFVMPERAAAARGLTIEEAQAFVWDGVENLDA